MEGDEGYNIIRYHHTLSKCLPAVELLLLLMMVVVVPDSASDVAVQVVAVVELSTSLPLLRVDSIGVCVENGSE